VLPPSGVTSPRIAVSGATTALVRRTTMRKAFLAPWDPMVEQMWLYSLADAQRETGVEVHFSGLFITHHHSDVTPTRSNLPEFTRRFHRDMSCGLHTLLCARKYDAPRELFDDRRVLPLHGPPRHPRYYGQLERQNREHRVFLDALRDATLDDAEAVIAQMRIALNDRYPRPSLAGDTAAAVWAKRPALPDDRAQMRAEVTELAARIERDQKLEHTIAWRYAVENALIKRSYLTIERSAKVLSGFHSGN
jgi:hypothetical protein